MLEQRLREWPKKTHPTTDSSHGQAPIHDIIKDTLLCSHTGDLHNCLFTGYTKQLTETDEENYSETWEGP